MIAVARVVQNASRPVVKLMKNRIAAASSTAAAVSAQRPGARGNRTAGVLLAAAMRFFISFTTGLLAFWTTRATAIMELHAGEIGRASCRKGASRRGRSDSPEK